MFKKLIGYAKGIARRVTQAVTEIVRSAVNSLARAWARHSEHMAANPAYRAALVAATASVITQVRLDRLAVALIMAVVAVYAAAHHEDGTSWRQMTTALSVHDEDYGWDPR